MSSSLFRTSSSLPWKVNKSIFFNLFSSTSSTFNTETTPPSLPPLLPSPTADSISQILLNHHNPFHFTESSLQLNGIFLSPSLVHQILLRIQHSSKIALAFFNYAQKYHPGYSHDTTAFNILIDALCKVRQFDVAWQLLVQMDQLYQCRKLENEENAKSESVKPNFTTFYILVRRLISAGLTRQAIRAFDEMHIFIEEESDAVWKSYFCYLLDTLCKYGYVKVATEVFNKQKWMVQLDAKLYTILVYGWCKVKKIDKARRFLDEMIEKGIEPNVVTYNVLLHGICRRASLHPDERFDRVIRQAEQVFDEMQERRIDPDVTSYSILLHVYSRAHKPQLTLEKFRIMRERGICPSVVTYTSVIKCLCSCSMIIEAEELLNEMVSNGVSPTAATYNCFFKEYRGRKDVEKAMILYGKMKGNGSLCSPSIHTYNILLEMFVSLNCMGHAREIWNDVKASGDGPDLDSYTVLVHGLCEKEKWREACEYFVEMIERGYLPQKVTFEKLYKGLIQSDMLRTWRRLKKSLKKNQLLLVQNLMVIIYTRTEDDGSHMKTSSNPGGYSSSQTGSSSTDTLVLSQRCPTTSPSSWVLQVLLKSTETRLPGLLLYSSSRCQSDRTIPASGHSVHELSLHCPGGKKEGRKH